jgi:hypothetical protein
MKRYLFIPALLLPLLATSQISLGPCAYAYVSRRDVRAAATTPCMKTVGTKTTYRSEIDTTVWRTIWTFRVKIPCDATDFWASESCFDPPVFKMATLPKIEFSTLPAFRPIPCPIYYVAPYFSRVKKSKIIRA